MVLAGSGSPTRASRTTDFAPAAPTSAAPVTTSDLANLRRLLEHHALEPLARQRERRGKSADAAAGDDDGLFVPRGGWRCHRVHLPNSPDRCACARCGM